ncbi:Cytochrome p450 protein [Lasiodiplodia theobromae]|uniref:Cytochrome p450 protein n=1 Tax=Lasiodiplodia theobromae TaxID=45133 RepID=UPI0015C36756|nr:Cytochrome p450 protein [Lasiodiplodia theobromae]KAF4545495.1 Cytochrome p450 protein [Lasiodiplodia theobromae]
MTIEIVPSVAVGASQFGPILWTAVAIILTIISVALSDARPYPGLKLVGKEAGEIWNSQAKKRYVEHGVQLMKKAFQDCKGKAFQVIGSNGPIIILPPAMINEIRNNQNLSFIDFLKHANRLLSPHVAIRRRARLEAIQSGNPPPEFKDALGWLDETAGDRPYNVVYGQLMISLASMHSTSSTLMALMYHLLENPSYFDMLRQEMVEVLQEHGSLSKVSLYKLKLLDSCMKESQRLTSVNALSLMRYVHNKVTLSDGTHLPKGSVIAVPQFHMSDPANWGPDASRFDGHRFLRMREQQGNEGKWQFVSTSPDHYAFGHGQHACPGRFFASNEIKILMVHLLLKYDWKFKDGQTEQPKSMSDTDFMPDPEAVILCKERIPEVAF